MNTNIGKNAQGPLAGRYRSGGGSAESPEVVARDIFEHLRQEDVVFFPGAAGRSLQ